MRACRDGIVDFGQARLRDVHWWRRVNLLVDSLAAEDDWRLLDAAYRYHLALVANSQLTEDSWKQAKKNASGCFNDLIGLLHPWGARSSEQRQKEEFTQLRELYKQLIGDPDDPEFRKKLQAEVERMNRPAAAEAEGDEARVMRLLRARGERRDGHATR